MSLLSGAVRALRGFGWRKGVAVLVLAAIVAVVFALLGADPSDKSVQIETMQARDIRPSVFASGQIIHGDEVSLTSQIVGKVKAVYVGEGEAVEEGQLVLAIDDEEISAHLERNRAAVRLQEIEIERKRLDIDNLQRHYERNQQLYRHSLLEEHAFEAAEHRLNTARIDFDSAQELLAQAQATLEQSLQQLERTRVRSPLAGVVTSLDIEVGETAIASSTNIPGSGLMVIADPASILTEVYVDEADVSSVHVGQEAEVTAVAYPKRPLAGTVEFIANTAKQELGRRGLTFRVRIAVADDALGDVRLRPGMSCRAEIFMASGGEVPALPIRAIVSKDDLMAQMVRHSAFVFEPDGERSSTGRVRKASLEVGRSDDEFREVLAGATIGQRFVVGPARTLRLLRDGEAVAVAPAATILGAGGQSLL